MSSIVRIISALAAAMFLFAGAAACSSSTEDTKADENADTEAIVDQSDETPDEGADDDRTEENADDDADAGSDSVDGGSLLAEIYGADADWCDIANEQNETDIDDVDIDAGFAAMEELMESPEKFEAAMNAMVEIAPDEIKGDMQTLVDMSMKMFSGEMNMDFSSGEVDPEFEAMMAEADEAEANIDAYNAANC